MRFPPLSPSSAHYTDSIVVVIRGLLILFKQFCAFISWNFYSSDDDEMKISSTNWIHNISVFFFMNSIWCSVVILLWPVVAVSLEWDLNDWATQWTQRNLMTLIDLSSVGQESSSLHIVAWKTHKDDEEKTTHKRKVWSESDRSHGDAQIECHRTSRAARAHFDLRIISSFLLFLSIASY